MDKRFESLYEKIEAAIEDLTTLKIVTAVGNVTISETTDSKGKVNRLEKFENAKAIISTIDLLDGDMRTAVDEVFTTNETYAAIYSDHNARIDRGDQIVKANIQALKAMIEAVRGMLADKETEKEKDKDQKD